jgi:hypothetical protein
MSVLVVGEYTTEQVLLSMMMKEKEMYQYHLEDD